MLEKIVCHVCDVNSKKKKSIFSVLVISEFENLFNIVSLCFSFFYLF